MSAGICGTLHLFLERNTATFRITSHSTRAWFCTDTTRILEGSKDGQHASSRRSGRTPSAPNVPSSIFTIQDELVMRCHEST